VHAVAAQIHVEHGTLGYVLVYLLAHRLVGVRVEGQTGGIDRLDTFLGKHVEQLLENHAHATRELGAFSGVLRMREGTLEIVDSGQHLSHDTLTGAADREWEGFVGATFPGLYAMIAKDYMHRYPLTRKQLAQVAVKNHFNGARNPIAQYQQEITIETVLKSTMVAEPLRLFDCSPITDGAAAVIVAPLERAREFTDTPIKVLATAQASDSISLHDRRDISTLDATVAAGQRAFRMAKLSHKDIDMVEVHDCFSIAEICAIEDLGFCKKGTAGKITADGDTELGGKIPVNTSGGLKACGHPVGATGIKQVYEIVQQLRNNAGRRQIDGAKIGMTHNVGGTGATAVVHILGRV